MKHHKIKILPEYFGQVATVGGGKKRFEIRKNDRDYQVGDTVTLQEWEPDSGYTGNEITIQIGYLLKDCPEYGLLPGYCIFSW
ncbi:DUF3850 domain-containing protein [Blautia schinkii]|nr:DUF3850 domain-containing protein [Blautia schinkii]